jgi:hypothetical protein
MALDTISAAVTAVVSLALMISMYGQYLARRRPYAFWWGLSFLAAALGAALQAVSLAAGRFSPDAFRLYVVAAASVPGVMGAGSLYLNWPKVARYFAILVGLAVVVTAWGAVAGHLAAAPLGNPVKAGDQVATLMPSWQVTVGFAVLGSLGAAALVLGALWSWWRSRLAYNLGIAAGGIVFSLGNSLAALGVPALFFAAEIVGIVALFLAVRAARLRHAPATQAPAEPEPVRA